MRRIPGCTGRSSSSNCHRLAQGAGRGDHRGSVGGGRRPRSFGARKIGRGQCGVAHGEWSRSIAGCRLLATGSCPPSRAADAGDRPPCFKAPVGKDWVTNGGNLTNQRYSTLKQIDTTNVKQLKGAWMTRLKGSGFGGKYSFEASPLVKDGIMYVVTGNDDVFALNAKTGEILWEHWSGIDQKISTVCCGWVNRGLAMGEGMLFLGQLDANVVALDIKTGKEVWKTPIEEWQNGYRHHQRAALL